VVDVLSMGMERFLRAWWVIGSWRSRRRRSMRILPHASGPRTQAPPRWAKSARFWTWARNDSGSIRKIWLKEDIWQSEKMQRQTEDTVRMYM